MKGEIHICENTSCGKTFIRQKVVNVYCSRRCFKKAYYYKQKNKERQFPVYRCPKCNTSVQLDFDPAKRWSPWLNFKCPNCNTLMISVVDEIETQDNITA